LPTRRISGKDGWVVRLKDVARVELVAGWSTVTSLDGKPGVFLLVHRSADADARGTAKAVRARLAELVKQFPSGIDYRVVEGDH
jgi:multidrug efflux pump